MSERLVVQCTDEAAAAELRREISSAGIEIAKTDKGSRQPFRSRGALSFSEIALALGSAGAFSALMKTILAFLAKDRGRRISLKRKGVEVTVEGHSVPEERVLLEQLFPELAQQSRRRTKARMG